MSPQNFFFPYYCLETNEWLEFKFNKNFKIKIKHFFDKFKKLIEFNLKIKLKENFASLLKGIVISDEYQGNKWSFQLKFFFF